MRIERGNLFEEASFVVAVAMWKTRKESGAS